MKMRKMFLAALVGLGMLTGCNNEEIPAVNNDGTKSVALRLNGLTTSTRAVEAPQAGTAEGQQIALSSMTIYFTNGTNILKKETLTSSSVDSEGTNIWQALTGTSGYIFHQLPSTVTQVQIVGNSGGKTFTETSVAELKASVRNAADEQSFTNVTLFGEDTALDSPDDSETGDEHVSNVLEASVILQPLIARFEIGNIACLDMGQTNCLITKYDLKVIGLMDFNSGVTLDGTASGTEYTLDNVLEPGSQATEGMVIFGEADDEAGWAWDKISGATNITSATPWNPGTGKKFVYQFVPNSLKDGSLVQVKLVLDNIEWADGSSNPFNSVVTARFNKASGGALTEFEAGKIYTVDYQFNSTNIGPWNPDNVVCVQLNVTVANWNVIALTPVFE